MLTFAIDTDAKMTSGNVRKERHGQEDGVLALDLDFELEDKVDLLEQMALGDTLDWGCIFDKDGQVKNLGIKKIIFAREFEEHDLSVHVGDRDFRFPEVHLKKFSAEPVFGNRIKLRFQAQVHPDETDIGPVLEGLVNGCHVQISWDVAKEEAES